MKKYIFTLPLLLGIFSWSISDASACAVCYGISDSPLAKGLNMGIFSLLIVLLCVLGCVAVCFLKVMKRIQSLSGKTS